MPSQIIYGSKKCFDLLYKPKIIKRALSMYQDSKLECPDLIQPENSLKDSFVGFKPGKDFLTYSEIAKFDNTIGHWPNYRII